MEKNGGIEMNLFKELAFSIYHTKSYPEFMKDRKAKTFFFGVLLVSLYFILTMVVPMVKFQITTGGVIAMLDEMVPDFYVKDGKAHVEKRLEMEDEYGYYLVDTQNSLDIPDDELEEYFSQDSQVFVVEEDRIIIKSTTSGLVVATYDELDPELDLTKAEALAYLRPWVIGITIAVCVVSFIWMQATFFFGVIFVALFGLIVASCLKTNMTFGESYKMAIYTRTTPLLIKALCSFLPFTISGILLWIIGLAISLAYFAAGVKAVEKARAEEKTLAVPTEGYY